MPRAALLLFLLALTAPALATAQPERPRVSAVRITAPLRIDGALDEALYREVAPVSGFIQVEPDAGAAATERTEAWVAFDGDHVYVSFRVWDTQMDRLVATEMRRDHGNIWSGNDIIVFVFDTFNDRRSSISFTVNALGGRSDGQVINERQFNPDWNPVWDLKTGRFDGGWTLETAIPFKSIRYQPGTEQVWGFNAMRVKRSKNEISTLSPVPAAQGQQGVEQPAFAATLVGIQAPPRRASLDVKPYAAMNQDEADAGVDVKYAVTQNLAADFTYNTDFAQVEADQQQVNLTRFSLFFPEKREFFLENQGTFSFGGVAVGSLNAGVSDAPILFYSRRIGLHDGRPVPIDGGGRLTGRAGAWSVGLVNMQAGDEERTGARPTNFTVARLKRDVLGRSSVGLMATHRSHAATGGGSNTAFGLDGTFALVQNLQINTYWAHAEDTSYRAQLEYTGDRYGAQVERLGIGERFNPEIGFVRRTGMRRDFAQLRFSPRARPGSPIRKFVYQAGVEHIEDAGGALETRTRTGEFALDFRNADRLALVYTNNYEFLPAPFAIGRGVTLPVGGYRFDALRLNYNMGQQRLVSANLSADYGAFYNGHKLTLSAARGRVPISARMSLEPTYAFNKVTLDEGRFTTHLAGARVTFTMSPMMFVSALLQYNSSTSAVSTNARLRWEYRPGSELFIVYNEERDTLARRFPQVENRALIVKINRLFRF